MLGQLRRVLPALGSMGSAADSLPYGAVPSDPPAQSPPEWSQGTQPLRPPIALPFYLQCKRSNLLQNKTKKTQKDSSLEIVNFLNPPLSVQDNFEAVPKNKNNWKNFNFILSISSSKYA